MTATESRTPLLKSSLRLLMLGAATFALSACGGGGGGGGSTVTPPTGGGDGSSGPTFTPGVFAPESDFAGQCATPRAGTSDRAGSTLLENHWLRSWSNRTYLWYDEITDQNPADFSDRLVYFEELKTTATTASGTPRDQFHFTVPTEEYLERLNSGSSSGYGARFTILSSSVPRDVRIAYVEPNSPASAAGLDRGAEIISVNGVSVVNGSTQADVDVINEALFSPQDGVTYTFVVRDLGATEDRTVNLTAATVTTAPVLENNIISTTNAAGDDIDVGYVLFNTFGTRSSEEALFDAFTDLQVQGIDELVLDLRYNGGGLLDVASELGYMIAGPTNTNGRIFEELQFNDKYPTVNPVTGATLAPTPFYSRAQGFTVSEGTALPTVSLDRIYVLTTSRTCSASESVMNSLKGIDIDVIQIGSRTCGKPYGFYGTDNCGETYFTIQFRGANDKGFGDYADGFAPTETGTVSIGEPLEGCTVGDDFTNLLGDTNEAMLDAALTHLETGNCPAAASAKPGEPIIAASKTGEKLTLSPQVEDETSLLATPEARTRLMLEQRRILSSASELPAEE